jgi:hypothetical protein
MDYSFMKTGDLNSNDENDTFINLLSVIMVFTEESLRIASTYTGE